MHRGEHGWHDRPRFYPFRSRVLLISRPPATFESDPAFPIIRRFPLGGDSSITGTSCTVQRSQSHCSADWIRGADWIRNIEETADRASHLTLVARRVMLATLLGDVTSVASIMSKQLEFGQQFTTQGGFDRVECFGCSNTVDDSMVTLKRDPHASVLLHRPVRQG